MQPLTREAILKQAGVLPREVVATPEWGEATSVIVRALTALERDQWELANYDLKARETKVTMANARARLAVLCVIDEAGERVFRDEDANLLGRSHSAPLDRIFEVCRRLSGMMMTETEILRKNSVNGSVGDSPAGLPSSLVTPTST
jgi:hypothetical protein